MEGQGFGVVPFLVGRKGMTPGASVVDAMLEGDVVRQQTALPLAQVADAVTGMVKIEADAPGHGPVHLIRVGVLGRHGLTLFAGAGGGEPGEDIFGIAQFAVAGQPDGLGQYIEPQVVPQGVRQTAALRVHGNQGGERSAAAQGSPVPGPTRWSVELQGEQGGDGTGGAQHLHTAALDEMVGVVLQGVFGGGVNQQPPDGSRGLFQFLLCEGFFEGFKVLHEPRPVAVHLEGETVTGEGGIQLLLRGRLFQPRLPFVVILRCEAGLQQADEELGQGAVEIGPGAVEGDRGVVLRGDLGRTDQVPGAVLETDGNPFVLKQVHPDGAPMTRPASCE